jgi:hypothetical protein
VRPNEGEYFIIYSFYRSVSFHIFFQCFHGDDFEHIKELNQPNSVHCLVSSLAKIK